MASTVGKLLFGGGAVFIGYKFGNSTLDSFTQKSKYTPKKISERLRMKPGGKVERRSKVIDGLQSELLDVLVVGGNLDASRAALDCSTRGLKTGIVDSEDFNSNIEHNFTSHEQVGSLSKVVERFTDEKNKFLEKLVKIDQTEEYFQYLKSAPHLASVTKILVLIPTWFDFPLQYIGNKLSDVLVNKPPKYSSKLVFQSSALNEVPWCKPETIVGGVEVTEVMVDSNRLNLSTVMSAAQWGALTLNHCTVVNVEKKEDFLVVGLEDKIENICYEVKTKVLLKLNSEENKIEQRLCFEIPSFLVKHDNGVCLPNKKLVIQKTPDGTIACLEGCIGHKEAFDKLKKTIENQFILRKGEVSTKTVETYTKPTEWEILTASNTTNIDINNNPVDEICKKTNVAALRPSQMSDITLEGGHGWFPWLGISLCSRYGLSSEQSELLVGKYGDQAPGLAKLWQEKKIDDSNFSLQEVEIIQACREMAQTVTHVVKRLNIQDDEQILVIADIMAKQLGWGNKFKANQIARAQEYFELNSQLDKWKTSHNKCTQISEIEENFINIQKDKFKNISQFGLTYHGQVEDIILNQEHFISEDTLEVILREVDFNKNGEYDETEFIELMRLLHVKTPKEVIEKHVQNIIEERNSALV